MQSPNINEELLYAKEGLQHIQEAKDRGEYAGKEQQYNRDTKNQEQFIGRLENKLKNEKK